MVEPLGTLSVWQPPGPDEPIGTHLVRFQVQRIDDPASFGWVSQLLVALKPQFGEGEEIAKVLTFREPALPATLAAGLRELADAIEGKK